MMKILPPNPVKGPATDVALRKGAGGSHCSSIGLRLDETTSAITPQADGRVRHREVSDVPEPEEYDRVNLTSPWACRLFLQTFSTCSPPIFDRDLGLDWDEFALTSEKAWQASASRGSPVATAPREGSLTQVKDNLVLFYKG